MGCGQCFALKKEPKRNHIKKIKDIYNNYLKSKDYPVGSKGIEQLSPVIVEDIERYTK
jgi:hypothetical protein